MKEQGIDEPLSITSYSLATLLRLAEQGLGIAVVPTLTALKEITDGRLEILNTPIQLKRSISPRSTFKETMWP